MIVLQCIADAAHLVHGPIACFGNSWESRGTVSDKGDLHRRAYTTDLSELEIIHGKGTGYQRDVVSKILESHPAVKSFRLAPAGRGHWGATVVEMKECEDG